MAYTFGDGTNLVDGAAWALSFVRINNYDTPAVTRYAENIQLNALATSGGGYEKAGLLVQAQTSDSSATADKDCVGIDARGMIASGNTHGRAWGMDVQATTVDSTADGFLIAAEFSTTNLGVDQPAVDQANSKYGLNVLSSGTQPATAAVYVNSGSSSGVWHKGIYAKPSAFGTSASDSFIELAGRYVVKPTGEVAITTSGSPQSLIVSDQGSYGVNILLTGNGTTTPSKFIRAGAGNFEILNNSYNPIFTLADNGFIFGQTGMSINSSAPAQTGWLRSSYGSAAASLSFRNHANSGDLRIFAADGGPSGVQPDVLYLDGFPVTASASGSGPAAYLPVVVGGTSYKIPLYAW